MALFADDWGRLERRWEMVCSKCIDNYRLFTSYKTRMGITEPNLRWVPKSLVDQITGLERQIDREIQRGSQYVKSLYTTGWQQYFDGKSRKAIWRELTQDGALYPSISTFYSHARQVGIDQVLDSYLGYHNIQIVVDVLGLEDNWPDESIQAIQKLEVDKENRVQAAQEY